MKGKICEKEMGKIFISYYSSAKRTGVTDSCKIIDGQFSFSGDISYPTVAFCRLENSRVIDDETLIFFLEPLEMKILIKTDPFQVEQMIGSVTQYSFDSLQKKKLLIAKSFSKQLDYLKGTKDFMEKRQLKDELKPYYDFIASLELNYIKKHPNSFASAFLLQFYLRELPLDTIMQYFNSMSYQIQSSIYGKAISEKILQKEDYVMMQSAPEFSSFDKNGKHIKLSNYKGKYLLLDFWASWCMPCRKEHPVLIELYKRYKSKGIEFIGIADDDNRKEKWIEAIQKDKLPWPQVLRGRKTDEILHSEMRKTDIVEIYGIESLPTLILIDPEGLIIGRYEENISDLKNDLKRIFQE